MRLRIWIAVAAATASALVGCAKPASDPTSVGQSPSATSQPSATATPTPTPVGEEQIGGTAAILEDGRHPVYLKAIDMKRRTVTFDLVIFLTGPKAEEEWAKEHPGEGGPPNDYMIVNNNPKLRTLPLITGAKIQVIDMESTDVTKPVDASLTELRDLVASPRTSGLYWITVRDEKITRVEGQYLP
jgi:hypothetical protein